MKAKQRDGPRLVKKMLMMFAHGLLIDIAVGAIFLGLGALLFGPVRGFAPIPSKSALGIKTLSLL